MCPSAYEQIKGRSVVIHMMLGQMLCLWTTVLEVEALCGIASSLRPERVCVFYCTGEAEAARGPPATDETRQHSM